MTAQPPLNPEALRDLYEACKRVERLYGDDCGDHCSNACVVCQTRAAIKKAEQS